MEDISLFVLFIALLFLILASAFFSGSETGLLTLNRYKLKTLSRKGHKNAQRAEKLLNKPDRLIGLILLGNNFVNILAASIATVVAVRMFGEIGIAIASITLTIVILIFAEVTPKTLAILYPEKLAFPASAIFIPLLKLFYPLVFVINLISNSLLKIMGLSRDDADQQHVSVEELRMLVHEAGSIVPGSGQNMLLNILDLERATVEDIMIPRNDIVGIDITGDLQDIIEQIVKSPYTKFPIYEGNMDHVIGMLHVRHLLPIIHDEDITIEEIRNLAQEPYYVPEATQLMTQLMEFQQNKQRIGLVVNEYGDIEGLIALEDILEEIVGEFTSKPTSKMQDIHAQEDGSYLIEGTAHVRNVNRLLDWKLPTKGAKTINGMIIEYLETIPEPGTSLLIANHPIEIVQTKDNVVKLVRIMPGIEKKAAQTH